jgi:hypothetical protein
VSVETLASRCVTVAYSRGVSSSSGHLEGFDQEAFASFAPMDDAFDAQPKVGDLERADLSWANRRAFARGRAAALSPTGPAPTTV